jgi:ribonuclease BN (tRNA processing enzyme)
MECSFVRNKPVEKHLEVADAIHLIRRAEPGRVVLTHLYPEWDEADFEKEVKEVGVEVVQAFDGMRLKIEKVKSQK